MKRFRVKLEADVVKYARFMSGISIDDASIKIKISEEELINLENNGGEIFIAELKRMAEAYKIPISYFFLKEKPDDVFMPDDFRIIYESGQNRFSQSVMSAIRKARYVQSIIEELSEKHDFAGKFFSVSIESDVDVSAHRFRSLLGASIEDQGKLSSPAKALKFWKEKIENQGIFVLQQTIKDDVSAFSLVDKKPFVILLNSSENENRRIFSLFHEIAHILLHRSGICVPDNLERNTYEYRKIEAFCNSFAGAFLMPTSDVLKTSVIPDVRDDINCLNEVVLFLSRRYRVSREVVARRLMDLGVISREIYESKREEFLKEFEEAKKEKKSFFVPQYTKIINQNGRAYTALVFENIYSNKISLADASSHLNMSMKHMSDVQAHL